ncbi:MAG TPA: hypothetical protein VMV92_34480 [Streptosporangiaceae bacterium]|nr:hypothetical protein [Streptosporangiaceae bacterium]
MVDKPDVVMYLGCTEMTPLSLARPVALSASDLSIICPSWVRSWSRMAASRTAASGLKQIAIRSPGAGAPVCAPGRAWVSLGIRAALHRSRLDWAFRLFLGFH